MRRPMVDAAIDGALNQNLNTLRSRSRIRDKNCTDYLPSECLVHLIRDAHRNRQDVRRDTLLNLLFERCAINLLSTVADSICNAEVVRKEILNDLGLLFARDGTPQCKLQLDMFEAMFNLAFQSLRFSRLRVNAISQARSVPLPDETEGSEAAELDSEVRTQLAQLHNNSAPEERERFRRVAVAIQQLPCKQRHALLLVHYVGYLTESKDPTEITAATIMGISGRMVRNHLSRAKGKLLELKEDA